MKNMKMKREFAIYLFGLGIAMVLGLVIWGLLKSSASAQAPLPVDLTGETCLGSTATIDPDGAGPLPPATYCVMNGNLGANMALEMDDIDGADPVSGNAGSVADANLTSGTTANDPHLPAVPGATYIDWADLSITSLTGPGAAPLGSVENHRILDFTANGDFTMLKPQASSCLNSGSVLPKEDFTQGYIANNNNFLYFAQERRTNNGNSVYYWLLTKKPVIVVPSPDCGSSTRGQVQFNLSAGDVELLVNFPDSSDPAGGGVFSRPYTGPDSGYIPARDAVFHPNWSPVLVHVKNFALNIAEAPYAGDDGFPPWGGIDSHGDPVATGSYPTATFAEWAVDLAELFGGQPLCGKQLFITAMSRASTGQIGSLTEPSALKDLVGPKLYSFGAITAAASLTGSCNLSFGYTASAVGIDGVTPINPADLSASWTCTDPDGHTVTLSDPNALSGTGTVPRDGGAPHTINCTVTVTDNPSQCTDDAEASTTVFAPILVNIAPNATSLSCTVPNTPGSDNGNIGPGVTFSPTVSGGNGIYTFTWQVNGPNTATCGNAATCIVDIPDSNFCALTTVNVTVDDVGNSLCPAVTSENEEVTKVTTVNATNH